LTDAGFKAQIVQLILNGKTEDALDQLAEEYQVSVPSLRIGLPKGISHRVWLLYFADTDDFAAKQ